MTMVDIKESLDENGKPTATISTNKMNTDIIVQKTLGPYAMFSIRYSKGHTPKELCGDYTSFTYAVDAVKKYLRNKKETPRRLRDKRYEDAPKLHSSSL